MMQASWNGQLKAEVSVVERKKFAWNVGMHGEQLKGMRGAVHQSRGAEIPRQSGRSGTAEYLERGSLRSCPELLALVSFVCFGTTFSPTIEK